MRTFEIKVTGCNDCPFKEHTMLHGPTCGKVKSWPKNVQTYEKNVMFITKSCPMYKKSKEE